MALAGDNFVGNKENSNNSFSDSEAAAKANEKVLLAAIHAARTKLLDRSLRNKLIHTNVGSPRARQIRVIDELSSEVFEILRAGKAMTFVAASRAADSENAQSELDEGTYVPPIEDEVGEVAARHKDLKLQTRLTVEGLQKRLLNLYFEAQALEEEQGVNILYLALGFLEWREAKSSDIPRYAPLVLVPVELIRDGARDRFKLKSRAEDLLTNFSLQAWLKEQFAVELPDLPDIEELDSIKSYFDAVKTVIGTRSGWKIHENEIVLGFFSFAKFLLWRDLDPENWPDPDLLTGHDILKKILLRSKTESEADIPLLEEGERLDDKFSSSQLIHITEADSSQAIAIQEALAGKNLVIQGPPGTGKSQTITNLIAAAVENGKRVLFIAEKMAALDVVHTRLSKARLGNICLELHGRKAVKTQVLEQIRAGMTAPVPPSWSSKVFDEVDGAAKSLRSYSDTLHAEGPSGLTPFELMGKMALLRRSGTPTPDFVLPVAKSWTETLLEAHSRRTAALADRLFVSGVPAAHPWRGVGIDTPDLFAQDRLRPAVIDFKMAALELNTQARTAARILNCEEEIAINAIPIWIDGLEHLHTKPLEYSALIENDAFLKNSISVSAFLDTIDRIAALKLRISNFVSIFDTLAPDSVPKNLAGAWSCVARRPRGFDSFLTSNEVAARSDELTSFARESEKYFELREALDGQVIESAFDTDWLDVRKSIAAHGQSIFRWFSSEYRGAIRLLRSVSKTNLKSFEQRIGLLDLLLKHERARANYEQSINLAHYFGPIWQGKETDWALASKLLGWINQAKGYEPHFLLRNTHMCELIDSSQSWPHSDLEQQKLIGALIESRESIEKVQGDDLCLLMLAGCNDWSSLNTNGLRAALAWTITASKFEPALHLRTRNVDEFAATAAEVANSLRRAAEVLRAKFATFARAIELETNVAFDRKTFEDLTPGFLEILSHQYDAEFERITEWPPLRDDLAWLNEIGCGEISNRIYDGRLEARHLVGTLLSLSHEAMWQLAKSKAPSLERTHGDELNTQVQRFRGADKNRIEMASDQVARSHTDQKPVGSAGAVGVLKDELKKSRKLKPVRRLIEEAGEAIQRFKPIFLMSPLSVAQHLPPGQLQFDLCVIDEASQVRPEDALGAIARCKQVVVVGDDKQLPPTNFFSRMVADEDVTEDEDNSSGEVRAAAVTDVESILNLCSRFPERMLRWHYRSEHPALIATSNRNFYKNQLMLPPSVMTGAGDANIGLQFVTIRKGGYGRGKTATNEIEAEEVAKAVLEHAQKHPTKSLGIGTFSVSQRDCIRDRLEHWAAKYPEMDEFIRGTRGRDPLFVKNLENIQGDERDVIFISVGYGHDEDGRLTQQFGPIGRDGGERRLNVLITRARQRCVVFSSIFAEDIKTEGVPKPGVFAFREFLKLAKDGFKDFPEATAKGFDSDFEESVAIAIRELGYTVHPQVGMAGFFVDLGVIDPRDENRYLLGVECDGAAYHSSSYSRDRDRLRQTILESRGWKMHRVWSTDWFYRQDREIAKLKAALASALSQEPLPTAVTLPASEPLTQSTIPIEPPAMEEEGESFSLLPKYQLAAIKPPRQFRENPHDLPLSTLAELAIEIVAIEQPIHAEEVGRRLASAFDLQRAGSRIQDAASRGLKQAARWKRLTVAKGFWRLADGPPVPARDRSQLAASAMVRRPELICPTEIAQAARVVLTASLAMPRQELITETARALGFLRTGPDVSQAISKAITTELASEVQQDHLGRVRLVKE